VDKGEGFALFRWRALNLDKWVLPESRPKLTQWPILPEWPSEKRRREETARNAQRTDCNEA
jgi:hypothetical protein